MPAERRRIDIGENVYLELERVARWLGMSKHDLATLLVYEGIERMKRDVSPAIGLAGIREPAAHRENTTSAASISGAFPSGGEGQK